MRLSRDNAKRQMQLPKAMPKCDCLVTMPKSERWAHPPPRLSRTGNAILLHAIECDCRRQCQNQRRSAWATARPAHEKRLYICVCHALRCLSATKVALTVAHALRTVHACAVSIRYLATIIGFRGSRCVLCFLRTDSPYICKTDKIYYNLSESCIIMDARHDGCRIACICLHITLYISLCAIAIGVFACSGLEEYIADNMDDDYIPVFTCENGVPVLGTPSGIVDIEFCIRCDSDYLLESNICRMPMYFCNNGDPQTGSPEGNEDQQVCIACYDGFLLNDMTSLCEANTYTCMNGTPVDGGPEMGIEERCAMCNPSYSLNDMTELCDPNSHSCENGMAAEGMPLIPDEPLCAMCDGGYVLEDGACREAIYICSDGMAESGGPDIGNSDVARCITCDPGYHLDGDLCPANTYTCMNGTPAADGTVGMHGTEMCAACNPGYHPDGDLCAINMYLCMNGTAAADGTPGMHGAQMCAVCDPGYHP